MTADPRYADTLAPLLSFCERHGYRWRWKTEPAGDRWRATVQILDPTKAEHRDRVRVWIGSTGHAELPALASAISWSIDEARKRLSIDARWGIGDGKGNIAAESCPTSGGDTDRADGPSSAQKPRI